MAGQGRVLYDEEADVLYVMLSDADVDRSASLDDLRIIDFDGQGAPVGIEFINASAGIDLSDIPAQHRVEELLGESGLSFRVLA